jgi:predicted acyltransferase (DUF342 family)
MSILVSYKSLKIVTPPTPGLGGAALNFNFSLIADWNESTTASLLTLFNTTASLTSTVESQQTQIDFLSGGAVNAIINNGGSVAVDEDGNVDISANVDNDATVSINGNVAIVPSGEQSGDISITGTVSAAGDVTVAGDITVTGTIVAEGDVSVAGTVDGKLINATQVVITSDGSSPQLSVRPDVNQESNQPSVIIYDRLGNSKISIDPFGVMTISAQVFGQTWTGNVDGGITASSFQIALGAANGKVLTSDASGLGTWSTISQSQVTNLVSDLALKAPIDAPVFTGVLTIGQSIDSPGNWNIDGDGTAVGLSINGSTNTFVNIPTTALTGSFASPTFTGTPNMGTGLTVFGGTTSSFPALKRSTTTIQVRKADDSGFTGIQASSLSGTSTTGPYWEMNATAIDFWPGSTSGQLALHGTLTHAVPLLKLTGVTSVAANKDQFDMTPSWVDSTDASRKARIILSVYDTAAREFLRADASGSGVIVGIGGAALAANILTVTPVSNRTFGITSTGGNVVLNTKNTAGDTYTKMNFDAASFEWLVSGSTKMAIDTSGNLGIGTTSQFGSGAGVLGITNAATVPTTNPTGGGVLYVEGGALKFRGSSGTITTIAPA